MSRFRSAYRRRNFTFETLEERVVMSAAPVGEGVLVNDLVARSQSTGKSSPAAAVSSVNQVIVFEGRGPMDRAGVFVEVWDSDGTEIMASSLVNNTTRGEQHSPAVGVDGDGNFVVVWAGRGVGDKHGIFVQRFSADGTRLGEETLVNTTTGGEQIEPALAVAEDGSFVVTWSGVGAGDVSGVYMRRFDASGVAAGPEVLVNTTTDDAQTSSNVGYDAAGNIVVVWQSRHQDGSDWGVYGQWFDADATAVGAETQLNATTDGSQQGLTLATDPTGGIVAAWQSFEQDGDGWAVVARHFDDGGGATDDEVLLNDQLAGHQQEVAIALADDGQWLAAWSSGVLDGTGWETVVRSFEADGTANASEIVNEILSGENSGHQSLPAVAIQSDQGLVVWSGTGPADRRGVYARSYQLQLVDDGPQQAPDLAAIPDQLAEIGTEMEVTVTATDPNMFDELTFALDPDNSPADATIEQVDNHSAIIRWTPSEGEDSTTTFRVLVIDDGDPPLADSEEFTATLSDLPLTLDLDGSSQAGSDTEAEFISGGGAATLAPALKIRGADNGVLNLATVQLAAAPDGDAESLAVDTSGTAIFAEYDPATRSLFLLGADSVANYQSVLRTLTYDNTAADSTGGNRSVTVSFSDSGGDSVSQQITVSTLTPDLVAFAQALAASDTTFFGAAWCPHCTAQKELFQDGAQYLPFVEVTNPDRTLNQIGIDEEIMEYPTWEFPDGTRLEGEQTLQTISQRSGVAIPTSDQPFLSELSDTTLLVGSPLLVSLDGYDPNGGELTYSVTSDNPDVSVELLTGNRSARINVQGFGDMVFELLEEQAPRATERMITLAEMDFYKDIIFHRVINNFIIQGGDPKGDGSGGSTLGDFDDQFDPDLQHNRTGLLSMAKSTDDTNDSQFFITEGSESARHLDFNHTIFGVLVEGESNRDAISNTAVSGPANSPKPVIDVVMDGIDIFEDVENAVMLMKAADGATGTANITVTVSDQDGHTFERTFEVTLADDTFNGTPYLEDIPPQSFPRNTTAQVQLSAVDVENDPVFFTGEHSGSDYTSTISDTGLLEVTPPADFVGTLQVLVGVGKAENAPDDTQLLEIEFT